MTDSTPTPSEGPKAHRTAGPATPTPRRCNNCGCPESRGACHCDHDVFGPDCFKPRPDDSTSRLPNPKGSTPSEPLVPLGRCLCGKPNCDSMHALASEPPVEPRADLHALAARLPSGLGIAPDNIEPPEGEPKWFMVTAITEDEAHAIADLVAEFPGLLAALEGVEKERDEAQQALIHYAEMAREDYDDLKRRRDEYREFVAAFDAWRTADRLQRPEEESARWHDLLDARRALSTPEDTEETRRCGSCGTSGHYAGDDKHFCGSVAALQEGVRDE